MTISHLDEKGRCCGRKPLHYKRPYEHYFCDRCSRQYGLNGQQRQNWGWLPAPDGDGFVPRYPSQEYAKIPAQPAPDGLT